MEHRTVLFGDVTEGIYSKFQNPIVCARNTPVIEGFVPTTFSELSSVISSVGTLIGMVDKVDNLVLLPISSFRSKWKYYGVQYGLDVINDFTELLLSPCIFTSKLLEYVPIDLLTISIGQKDSMIEHIREDFIFEYMAQNHPSLNFRKLKIT